MWTISASKLYGSSIFILLFLTHPKKNLLGIFGKHSVNKCFYFKLGYLSAKIFPDRQF